MSGVESLAKRFLRQLFPNVRVKLDDTNLVPVLESIRIDKRRLVFGPI